MGAIIVRAPIAVPSSNGAGETGLLTKLALTPLGRRPYKCPEVVSAWWLLRSTHDSVSGLFDTLYLVRRVRASEKKQSTKGRLTGDAQDLLRTAIVFTSAGLDACLGALLTCAVPTLVISNQTARLKFERYIDDALNASKVNEEFRSALKDDNPRTQLMDLYIKGLIKSSFQGTGDIRDRARDALGVTNRQLPLKRITELNEFFKARNDVAHRMDHLGSATANAKPLRQARKQSEVGQMCDRALLLVRDLVRATAENIRSC